MGNGVIKMKGVDLITMKIDKQKVFDSVKDAKAYTKVMSKTYLYTILALLGVLVLVAGAFAGFIMVIAQGNFQWAIDNVAMWVFVSGTFVSLVASYFAFNPVSMFMLKIAKRKVAKKIEKNYGKSVREKNASNKSIAKIATE